MAYDFPAELFEKRVWISRARAGSRSLEQAAEWIRARAQPILVAGGGVHYSEATEALQHFVEKRASRSARRWPAKARCPIHHPLNLGAVGVTGTRGANLIAREADLVIGVGTRYSDFTTASKTAFQNPNVRFINYQRGGVRRLQARGAAAGRRRARDARRTGRWSPVPRRRGLRQTIAAAQKAWRAEVDRVWDASSRQSQSNRSPQSAASCQRRRDRRGAGHARAAGRGGLRRRQPAGRPAQAVAHARPEGLSPRIRLFVHGLRDRGRARRENGRAGSRSLRDGRRRLVPDDGAGDRHRGAGRRQADHRAARQSRLRQHRRAVGVGRQRRIRHALPSRGTGDRRAGRRHAADRSRRQRRVLGAKVWRANSDRRVPGGVEPRPRTHPASASSSSRSIANRASPATTRGGTCRWRRCRAAPRCRDAARRTSRRGARERDFL